MNVQCSAALAALLSMAPAAHAITASDPPHESRQAATATADADIARIESLGRSLFEHDLAAERATDALVAKGMRKDDRVAGWVTEQRDNRYVVSILGGDSSVLYRVVTDDKGTLAGPVQTLSPPEPLSPYEAGAAAARALALSSKFQACSKNYNTVVLPNVDGTANAWSVYLLPGTFDPAAVPLGGSHRVEIADEKITSSRPYTLSCITLQRPPRKGAMMVTHLLDPTPTEVHVYWSLWARAPLFVSTAKDVIWKIENGHISKVVD
ncbi:TPA: hypothetical protein QDZ99_001815 [Stenotrophomonas maltophilia]|uniref:hypothetical protein n=1 Tax=Stenotrophomonas TaxID=40323 RepID=UPI001042F893|nr:MULTISPECIES: hypothetical protein [Stenotrophomonas]EKT4087405.1 hypothetical protein [Stenotrophomonas maltophilia]EKU9959844.1 hypothetical protein [Stenotrophomonas maltophilia]EKU9986777.1 hypothetical protein [Stenotrophomonas maltophilia]HDS1127966.1 hypothetical protein [Stenotrophomonas maltophilia]HDS1155793.1 hypothetical protein [Stenotrophomonas maltophilia]